MIKKKPKLNKTLFWDVNIKDIDFDKHKKYVNTKDFGVWRQERLAGS